MSAAPVRPTPAFMLRHPARWIALGFGSGLSPVAPGTAGTVMGWALWVLVERYCAPSFAAWGVVIALGLAIGWWACTHTARALGVADPSPVVWDEIVAFWIILWLAGPAGWLGQAILFGLFRLFDAVKRGPVGWADACFKPKPGAGIGWAQGWGIIFDDLVAAACVLVVWFGGVILLAGWLLPPGTHLRIVPT